MKSPNPTTYLTSEELNEMACLKQLDATSGQAGARRAALIEEASALKEIVNARNGKIK